MADVAFRQMTIPELQAKAAALLVHCGYQQQDGQWRNGPWVATITDEPGMIARDAAPMLGLTPEQMGEPPESYNSVLIRYARV